MENKPISIFSLKSFKSKLDELNLDMNNKNHKKNHRRWSHMVIYRYPKALWIVLLKWDLIISREISRSFTRCLCKNIKTSYPCETF